MFGSVLWGYSHGQGGPACLIMVRVRVMIRVIIRVIISVRVRVDLHA